MLTTITSRLTFALQSHKCSLSYALWAKNISNTLKAIFASELENNDCVFICLLPDSDSEENGHAVSFVRITSGSNHKYYYRDINLGVFEIKDFSKFSEWFGIYLEMNEYVQVKCSILLPANMIMALEHIGNNSSAANKLKCLAVYTSADIGLEEMLSIDCSSLKNESDRKLYCAFGVIALGDSINNIDFNVLQTKILNTLSRCKTNDPDYIATQAMLAFNTAYDFWGQNNLTKATKYFKEFNDINHGLSKVRFSDNGTFNFKNVWLIKDEFPAMLISKFLELVRSFSCASRSDLFALCCFECALPIALPR